MKCAFLLRGDSVIQRSFCLLLAVTLFGASLAGADDNWPQFRGRAASGIGSGSPPTHWNVETGENIQWSVDIEGLAHSSPIVFDDRIYLTTAISASQSEPTLQTGWIGGSGDPAADEGEWIWQVICLDLNSGREIWKRNAIRQVPMIKRHLKASHANCSPATDGRHVVAFFGSEGLYCYSHDGELLWHNDLGKLHSGPYNADTLEWGFASSPVIHNSEVIVQCDCLNVGFVAIFDIATGKERLRIEREEVATWSTPAIITHGESTQIVCNGYKQIASYDYDTGELLWTIQGGGDVPVPTPLYDGDTIFITNGHGRSPVYAVSPDARGDLSPDDDDDTPLPDGLVWYQPKDGSYMPTPIIVGDRIYICNDNGRLTVRDCESGETVFQTRVSTQKGTFSASAVAAGGNLYFCNEDGIVIVVAADDKFHSIAENSMGEIVMATPAVVGDKLLIRGVRKLYCIAADDATPSE